MTTPAAATALTGSDQLVHTGQGSYRGITLRETGGSTAAVRVYDGTTAAGTILGSYALAANASLDVDIANGVLCRTGIYVDIVSGAVEGSVRIG